LNSSTTGINLTTKCGVDRGGRTGGGGGEGSARDFHVARRGLRGDGTGWMVGRRNREARVHGAVGRVLR